MREILFRGKRIDNGEWEYGGCVFTENKVCLIYNQTHSIDLQGFTVEENSVGQYAGLTDKNGEKIFEGDIVKYESGSTVLFHKVVFERRNGCAYFGVVIGENETWGFSNSFPSTLFEVAGNIYDNPELLEVNEWT